MAALRDAVDEVRQQRGLSWRQVGAQTELGHHLFARMRTRGLSVHALAVILVWMGDTDIAPYLLGRGQAQPGTAPPYHLDAT